MEDRRVFLKKLYYLPALGSMAFASSAYGLENFTSNSQSFDELLFDKKENNLHLAYFDPAKGHIPNPGMGINVFTFSDHMHIGYTPEEWRRTQSKPHMSLDKKTIDQLEHHPYADNMYIRMEWRDIQKDQGKLECRKEWHWILDMIEKSNKRWSFRIMNCSPHSSSAYSIPDFLIGKLKMHPYSHRGITMKPQPKFHAVYDDEYLKWWSEMLHLLGDMYDNHPLLEYADISGLGFWGEGHWWTGPNDNLFTLDLERLDYLQDTLINFHLQAFPNTPGVLNLHYAYEGLAGKNAIKNGVWLRRDSLSPNNFSPFEYHLIQTLNPDAAMVWEVIKPMESREVEKSDKYANKSFDQYPQRYFDFGSSYATIGFNAWDALWALKNCPDVYDNLANHLGYRIRPGIIWRHQAENQSDCIILGLVNNGCASAPGNFEITAQFNDKEKSSVTLDPGSPKPGKRAMLVPIKLPQNLQGTKQKMNIKLSINLKIKNKVRPVKWAVEQNGKVGVEVLEFPLYPL